MQDFGRAEPMHIVTVSPDPWLMDDAVFGNAPLQVTRIVAPLSEAMAPVMAAAPDLLLVVVADSGRANAIVRTLCQVQAQLPHCRISPLVRNPDPAILLDLMRAGITDVLVDDSAQNIRAVVERARQSAGRAMAEGDAPALPSGSASPLAAGRLTAFVSAKGGDGATFVAVNYAVSLAKADRAKADWTRPDKAGRVLLLDLSLPFGDAEIYLTAQKPSHDLADFVQEIDRLDGALLKAMAHHVSDDLDFIPSPLTMDRVVQIVPDQIPALIARVKHHYDQVIVDLGAGIDPVTLTVLDMADEAVVVATPEVPSVRRTSQILNVWDSLEYPPEKLSIVVNRHSASSSISSQAFETAIGKSIARVLPDEGDKVRDSMAKGVPVVELASGSRFAREMANWAQQQVGAPAKGKSLWQRLRNR